MNIGTRDGATKNYQAPKLPDVGRVNIPAATPISQERERTGRIAREMTKSLLAWLTLLVALTCLPWSLGCSGEDKAATPKSKEEIRKQYIDRADRMRKENSK